ncbi:MAG: hypothetical protein JSS00_13910 [Proteobacteria bacterium]|nr:hypothetical protein [Pseudomonadota bacterium]
MAAAPTLVREMLGAARRRAYLLAMGSTRVRLYSRLAALALAAIVAAAIAALRVQRPEQRFDSLTAISYIVAEPQRRETPPQREPQHVAQRIAASYIGESGNEPPARLWSYDAFGRIVFDHAEQYRRCVAARQERHNESDCPEAHDPHPLVLRPG